ncbi:hypothetical protein WJX72_008025 [[Myrmecia] bisecta]|uniref:Enoyl reductase (ER) domain-containing protein n=1 Tax=[Myrmecia] bisecta TaxID=41462 RepID=A0AAW1Q9K9_9CHLO
MTTSVQKALQVVQRADDLKDNLELSEVAKQSPGEGEVLVCVTLRPVNPTDLYNISGGVYTNQELPYVPGSEGVGTVEHLAALAVPDKISDKDAAQFWVNPVTVVGLLEVADVPKGEILLQTAAGSVLGREVITYAKHLGIKTINVVRRAAQKEVLLSLGADEVIVTSEEDLVQRVKEITGGEGAYAAIDAVGGTTFQEVVSAVRDGGTALIYGRLSGSTGQFNIGDLLLRRKVLRGFALPNWLNTKAPQEREAKLLRVLDLIASGVIKPYSGKVYPLEQFKEAISESQREGRGGKVFLEG